MGVLDKFLDIMKLSDDYDDDYFDDDYEEEAEKPKKSFFSKKNVKEPEDIGGSESQTDKQGKFLRSGSKVTPFHQSQQKRNASGSSMEVCVIRPSSYEDAKEIADTLIGGRTVILNLEGLDIELAQRLIDFALGSTYSIGGNLQKVSNYIFLLTPRNVDITGDLQDLLDNSLDSPTMRSRF